MLQYCANDVEMTAVVYAAAEALGSIRWLARSGKVNAWKPPNGAEAFNAPVEKVMTRPFADNSFMRRDRSTGKLDMTKTVPTRSQFVGWLD